MRGLPALGGELPAKTDEIQPIGSLRPDVAADTVVLDDPVQHVSVESVNDIEVEDAVLDHDVDPLEDAHETPCLGPVLALSRVFRVPDKGRDDIAHLVELVFQGQEELALRLAFRNGSLPSDIQRADGCRRGQDD